MALREQDRDDFSFEIREHLGILGTNQRGWTKELNRVAWNQAEPKYDIRDWNPTHDQMSRGVTLRENEMSNLAKLICELDI